MLLRTARILFVLLVLRLPALAQQRPYTAADYQRAEKFMGYNTNSLVLRSGVRPSWLNDERFWYRVTTADGGEFILVDPAKGTKEPAFDQANLASALSRATGSSYSAYNLPFQTFEMSDDDKAITFTAANRRWTCDRAGAQCEAATGNASATSDDASRVASISAIADANPGNHKLQWIVATSPAHAVSDDARINAIARVQDAESANAAAWALSLSAGGASDDLVDHLLQRMAASTRFDTHFGDAAAVMLDAMRGHPLPEELTSAVAKQSGVKITTDTFMKGMAYGIAFTTMPDVGTLMNACRANANAPRPRTCSRGASSRSTGSATIRSRQASPPQTGWLTR